jgi:hypothetical protein
MTKSFFPAVLGVVASVYVAGCGQVVLPLALIMSHSRAIPRAGQEISPARENVKTFKVKGLYLTGWTAGVEERIRHYAELADKTKINTYVVDIKDSDGYVGYESDVPEVRAAGAWQRRYHPERLTGAFHEHSIHVIGRLVCFKDPVLSARRPALAIQTLAGNPWLDDDKKTWLNPYNRESWAYLVAIAKEAVQKGFDEIQFDYIRFASDGHMDDIRFGDTRGKTKHEVIKEFLAYARKEMPDTVLSADVFGIICESPGDTEDIGQYLEMLGDDMDFISPMVYPSHYALGQVVNRIRYAAPDRDPYGVVHNTLLQAKRRIAAAPSFRAGMRPYLQDFTATWLGKGMYQQYGAEQVRQQIKAVYDAGYEQWILWSAHNKYTESALEKEPRLSERQMACVGHP